MAENAECATKGAVRCLICLKHKPREEFTLEHIFPESVGGTLTTRQVCKPCNDRLGHSVDCTVTDHALVQLARMALGIAGKTGHIPNPLERGYLGDNPQHKVSLRADPVGGGPLTAYTIPIVSKTITEPGKGRVSVRLDAEDARKLGEVLSKTLKRAGAAPLTAEQIGQLKPNTEAIHQPWINVPLDLDVSQYRRGLMKIVYELACVWLGDDYLDDPAASELRRFTLDTALTFDASSYAIHGTMKFAGQPLLMPFWEDERTNLIAAGIAQGSTLGIYVNVLGALEALIQVTDSMAEYPNFKSHFVLMDPRTGATRESSFEQESIRIGVRLGIPNDQCSPLHRRSAARPPRAARGSEEPASRRDGSQAALGPGQL
jgi:HNH endonuclease